MTPSKLPGAIVWPFRFLYMAVFAAMVATVSPFAASSSQLGSEPLAARYFDEVLLGRNATVTTRVIAPDAPLITPEGIYIGVDGVDQFLDMLDASFTDLVFVPERYQVSDTLAIVDFTMTGIHTGTYHDMAGNCAGINVPGVMVLTVSDAGIQKQWIEYDRELLAAQIDGFHQLDQTYRPDCDAFIGRQPAPPAAPEPERVPTAETPAHDANCVRRDRCDDPS